MSEDLIVAFSSPLLLPVFIILAFACYDLKNIKMSKVEKSKTQVLVFLCSLLLFTITANIYLCLKNI